MAVPVRARGKEPWRIICSCQEHRPVNAAVRWGRQSMESVTRNRGAVVLSLSLAVGGAWIPLKATTAVAGRAGVAVRVMPSAPAQAESISLTSPSTEREGAGSTFLPARSSSLLTEKIREEFFRTEIPFGGVIYREAKAHGLAPELIAAIVKTESDFQPRLISGKDAQGLMQIIPSTGRLMGARNLMEPADNIRVGTRYLRYLQRQFRNDPRLVLAAYNAGEGNVRRFGGIPPFRETQEYLERVAGARRSYQKRVASRLASTLGEQPAGSID